MNAELFVNVTPEEMVIALTEDKRLVELRREKRNVQFEVGDVYIGKVRKVMQGLNAAFVSVGYEKDAFLHYLDLGPNSALSRNSSSKSSKSATLLISPREKRGGY